MSLFIDIDRVSEVLLCDGWHKVLNASFDTDSYEFISQNDYQRKNGDFDIVHGGGNSGVCATGFTFHAEGGGLMAGPLTAILAVRYTKADD